MNITPHLDIASSLDTVVTVTPLADRTAERHTVTFAANRPLAATLTKAPFATAVDHARPLVAPGLLWRTASAIGDLLTAVGIVLSIPLVITVVGLPIALCLRFLLWIVGML